MGHLQRLSWDSLVHWHWAWARSLSWGLRGTALTWGPAHLHRERMKWEEYPGMENDRGRVCDILSPSDSS